jgi:acetylornithine deacetylase/succinyl-diaminopimelate desuccinylase-like protein
VTPRGEGYLLSALIEQTQAGAAYQLQVPVAVQLEGKPDAWQTEVRIAEKHTPVEWLLPARPLALDVDPEFDLFRRLDRAEIPPAVSQAMGAERVLLVLPSKAPGPLQAAYRKLAESWQAGNPRQFALATDAELETLPSDRTVWLFGWQNRFRAQLDAALAPYAFVDQGDNVRIEQTGLKRDAHAVVVMARQPANPDQALGWLAADEPAALPGLGRKLPHYGRYSYLAFSGDAPENVLKGQWPVVASPLSVRLETGAAAEHQAPARLAPRQPLADIPARFSRARLQRDLEVLTGEAMAGRGLGSAGIDRAADYIAGQFRAAGLQPGGDGAQSYFQSWAEPVDALGDTIALKNVIGVLPGSDPQFAGQSLVIGAHYDHFGRGEYADHAEDRGKLHPGADDNASGVAVMLELARVLANKPRPRSIVFVAFSGEETGRLGSRRYVQHAGAYPPGKMIAMLNLDTVGRLGDKPVTLFGTGSAEEWVHIFRGASYVTGVAVNPVADDFGSSDQTSFIDAGVPALQLFGGVHADIHRPGDTLDKIDVTGMVRVAEVLDEAAAYLVGRPEALTTTGAGRAGLAASAPPDKRRVSLGTVPDFTFGGAGVRIDDVRAGSPAAQAGLQSGDVIIAVNDALVRNMRDYAAALRQLNPGDAIRVRFRRGSAERTVTTAVVAR